MSNVAVANDMFDTMNKAYKIAEYMSKSDIIPKHFIGKPANIFIVLNSAQRMNLDPMLVMQNTFVISGKLGMNAAFAIAMANSSGLFSGGIRYRVEESPKPIQVQIKIESKYESTKTLDLTLRDIKVTAYTNIKDTGEEISYTVSMQDAIAEKWVKNEKYVSLPELMLRYRAATLLIRTHSPEVLNGLQTREELEDVAAAVAKDVTALTNLLIPNYIYLKLSIMLYSCFNMT